MATHYSSGQYEDAYVPRNLQNWSLPRVCKQRPSARDGYTQFVADDKGHLLPFVPRSKASPWGTYIGTWDMPLKIPPARVSLTSRSVDAAAQLTAWINKSKALNNACNGLVPEITGKTSDLTETSAKAAHPSSKGSQHHDSAAKMPAQEEIKHSVFSKNNSQHKPYSSHCLLQPSDPKETSAKATHPSSKGSQHHDSAAKMPAQGEIQHSGTTTPKGPLSRQPGSIDIRLKEDGLLDIEDVKMMQRAGSEIPLSRKPGSMDIRIKDAATPLKVPAPSCPSSRELTPRRATSAEAPSAGRPRSLEGKPKGGSTPELFSAHRPGSVEVSPKNDLSHEAVAFSRPATKGSQASEVEKTRAGLDEDRSELAQSEGSLRPPSCPEEPSC
ncbi:UNVERIFIED_CONTAM: hypothetical protein K2H54_017070 [Gekko kuhli]